MTRAEGSLTRKSSLCGRIKIRPYNICRAKGSFFNVLKLLRRSKTFIENYISDYQKAPAERYILQQLPIAIGINPLKTNHYQNKSSVGTKHIKFKSINFYFKRIPTRF